MAASELLYWLRWSIYALVFVIPGIVTQQPKADHKRSHDENLILNSLVERAFGSLDTKAVAELIKAAFQPLESVNNGMFSLISSQVQPFAPDVRALPFITVVDKYSLAVTVDRDLTVNERIALDARAMRHHSLDLVQRILQKGSEPFLGGKIELNTISSIGRQHIISLTLGEVDQPQTKFTDLDPQTHFNEVDCQQAAFSAILKLGPGEKTFEGFKKGARQDPRFVIPIHERFGSCDFTIYFDQLHSQETISATMAQLCQRTYWLLPRCIPDSSDRTVLKRMGLSRYLAQTSLGRYGYWYFIFRPSGV